MALRLEYVLVFAFVVFMQQTTAERGYIMTAPTRFIPGRPEKICVDMIDVPTNISIELSLYKTTHTVASQPISVALHNMVDRLNFHITPSEGSQCVSMVLPISQHSTTNYLALSIRGQESPLHRYGWSFYGQNIIRVLDRYTNAELSLIQTDKPLYKPSQTVQVRVMRLDTRLRPLNERIDGVSIVTPSGVKVEQWLNVAVRSGLASLTFHLSDDPEHGNWSIELAQNGKVESKTFTVEEYVLPTFEVTVKPPGYALLRDPTITAHICALYTYGQPVNGLLQGKICLEQPFMRMDIQKDAFCQNITSQMISGCTTIIANRMAAGWDYRYNDWRNSQLVFKAEVTENSTGTTVRAPETILKFTNNPFEVKVEAADMFKPGLPYHAKVIVTTADGKPAGRQLVNVIVDRTTIGQPVDYGRRYSTDNNGAAYITIPPFIGHSLSITVSLASSPMDPTTTIKLNPSAWYSPSGSFLQIVPGKQANPLPCGGTARLRVQYTTRATTNITLMYKVVGVGDITQASKIHLRMLAHTRINQRDPTIVWDTTSSWHLARIALNRAVGAKPFNPNEPDFDPAQTVVTATHKGSFPISFRVTSDLSPRGHLVVYYVRPDGEVVSDSMTLSIPECTENKVSLTLSKTEVMPGETVQLSLASRPGSVCGYGIVDKNAYVSAGQNYPTLASIVKRLDDYLLPVTSLSTYLPVNFYCENLHGAQPEYPGFASYWQLPSVYRQKDSHQGFVSGGLTVTTNLKVQTAPCKMVYYRTHSTTVAAPTIQPAGLPIVPVAPAAAPVGAKEPTVPDVMAVTVSPPPVPSRRSSLTAVTSAPTASAGSSTPQLLQYVKDVRSYFPETMLFDIINTNALGRANVQLTVPDTITQWIGNAVCTDEQDGLGVSTPVTLTAFQPIAVAVKLPAETAIRDEIIPVEVTVSNYLTGCLTVDLTLRRSSKFDILRSLAAGPFPLICVCGGETAKRVYNLALTDIGEDISVSVSALTLNNTFICPLGSVLSNRIGVRDSQTVKLNVQSEGIPREYTYTDFICMTNTGPLALQGFSKDYRLPRPSTRNRVPRSTRGTVTVVGDLMGAAISNIDKLIDLPSANGEQAVMHFLPHVFMLKYLRATRQPVAPAYRTNAVLQMKKGYQKLLTFSHPDGSYSSFGPKQPVPGIKGVGSVFLTAYAIKSLAHAKSFIFVDNDQQTKSVDFIVKQQSAWGCFNKVGMVHNKYMRGTGATSDNFALTAYVAIALLESGFRNVRRTVSGRTENVVAKALDCVFLRSHRFRNIRDAYTLSMVSYAFALYNKTDSRATRGYRMLFNMDSTDSDGYTYWRAARGSRRVSSGSFWYNRPTSADVETTSYALLSTMIMANRTRITTNGLSTVKWLNEDRNDNGGHATTQDTIMSIQSMTEFGGKYVTRGLDANLTVDFSRTVNGTQTLGPRVTSFLYRENSVQPLTVRLPTVRTLAVRGHGNGCLNYKVNVKYSILSPDNERQPFHTTITVMNTTRLSRMCQRMPLLICTSYVRGGESNMAVLDMKLQTGWAVEESLLKQLINYPSLKVKGHEISKSTNSMRIFFSSLNRARTCFFVYVNKIAGVRNGKPAVVSTYDYYKLDERQETTYQINC